jgi:hypothetical protein
MEIIAASMPEQPLRIAIQEPSAAVAARLPAENDRVQPRMIGVPPDGSCLPTQTTSSQPHHSCPAPRPKVPWTRVDRFRPGIISLFQESGMNSLVQADFWVF